MSVPVVVSPYPPLASAFAFPPPQPSSAPPSAAAPPASSSAPPGASHSAAWLALLFPARRFLVQLQGKAGKSNTGRFKL